MKKYTKPKIYPKVVTTKPISAFTEEEKDSIMKKYKRWYVYYSYLNSEGRMKRQPAVYFNVNREFPDFDDRLEHIKKNRNIVEKALKNGFSPLESELTVELHTVESALDFALSLKKNSVKSTSYRDYEIRTNQFKKYLTKKGINRSAIGDIDKKIVNGFLNQVLKKSSPRNRNNTRTVLSAIFTVLEDNDLINRNFIKNIKNLKSKSRKNKAFTEKEVEEIFELLIEKDKWLYYYYSHVYYALFRPVEVARIKIKHINLKSQLIESETKTGKYFKQIPNVLIEHFYSKISLNEFKKESLLFTKYDKPSTWETEEEHRRQYFWKRLKRIIKPKKDIESLNFKLTEEHTSYSFRHAAIGKIFTEKVIQYKKTKTPGFEEKALDYVRTITLHKNNDMVRNYLREIGYHKIDDWSNLLK